MNEVAGQSKDMGKRVRGIAPLYDLDARKKIIDTHKDYAQIIAYPQPPIERLAKSPQPSACDPRSCDILNRPRERGRQGS